jgi:hypothetical protein
MQRWRDKIFLFIYLLVPPATCAIACMHCDAMVIRHWYMHALKKETNNDIVGSCWHHVILKISRVLTFREIHRM